MIGKLGRCEREKTKSTTQTHPDLRREQGRRDSQILKNKRARQRTFMKHCEQTWNGTAIIGDPTGRNVPLHHLHNGSNTNTKTLNDEIIGGKSDGYRLFHSQVFFHRFRVQTSANVVHATRSEDRTPCRTHIFLSVAHLITDHHTHLRVAQVWDVFAPLAHLQSHPLTTCCIDHHLMCLTHVLPFLPHHLRLHRLHCL